MPFDDGKPETGRPNSVREIRNVSLFSHIFHVGSRVPNQKRRTPQSRARASSPRSLQKTKLVRPRLCFSPRTPSGCAFRCARGAALARERDPREYGPFGWPHNAPVCSLPRAEPDLWSVKKTNGAHPDLERIPGDERLSCFGDKKEG